MRLYYMTSHEIAVNHILPERRMKLSRFQELNDPFELKAHSLGEKDIRGVTQMLEREYFSRKGIQCFSDNWRSPVMWAHYAQKHRGICLGFDIPNDEADPIVRRINYEPNRVHVALDPTKEFLGLTQEFIHLLIYTKAKEWEYEREWRVIANLEHEEKDTGFYFVDFSPQLISREVILGCRNPSPIGQIAKLVRGNQAHVRVCKARPAFQEFAMVENKQIKAINVAER